MTSPGDLHQPQPSRGHGSDGLRYGNVRVVAYDPGWVQLAAQHCSTARNVLGSQAVAAVHIGSTAVPGLAAKPIVDIAVRLAPAADPETVIACLAEAGYLFMGEKADQGGLLFVWEPRPKVRSVHIHVIGDGDPQYARYLALVALLRAQPGLAEEYGQLKRRLAASHPHDRAAYTRAKADFLQRLLDEATAPVTAVQRVRAALISPGGRLLAIRRSKPGQDIYWVLPGGGIEPGDGSLEDALHREIREETGGHARLHRLIHIATVTGGRHAVFLGHIDAWDQTARTGAEFDNPANGLYDLDELPLDPDVLANGRIWPVPTTQMIAGLLRQGVDLFTLPDLRDTETVVWQPRGGTDGHHNSSSDHRHGGIS